MLGHTTILAGAPLGLLGLLLSLGVGPPAPAPGASTSGPLFFRSNDSHVLRTSMIEGVKPEMASRCQKMALCTQQLDAIQGCWGATGDTSTEGRSYRAQWLGSGPTDNFHWLQDNPTESRRLVCSGMSQGLRACLYVQPSACPVMQSKSAGSSIKSVNYTWECSHGSHCLTMLPP